MQGDVAAVVSEDSDLIVFGCSRMFFKMDNVRRRWLAGWRGCLAPRVWRRWREGVSPSHCICARPAGRKRTRVHSRQHAEPHWRPGSLCVMGQHQRVASAGSCSRPIWVDGAVCRWIARQISQQSIPPKSHVLASGHGDSVRLRVFGVAKGPRHQDRLPRSEGWRLCCRRHPQPSPRRRILLPARHAHCHASFAHTIDESSTDIHRRRAHGHCTLH